MQLTDLSSRVIPATDYRRERWRNQLGWTREILRLGDADAWSLRLSIAEIEQDAAFSAFPGIDRELVLLHGNGMRLRFGDGASVTCTGSSNSSSGSGNESDGGSSNDGSGAARGGHDVGADGGTDAPGSSDSSCDLLPPYQRVRFAGEEAVSATLLDGPTQDFNLMWRRDVLQAELLHRPLVGTMLFFADPGSAWALHLLAGQASFGRDSGLPPLVAGDTAWLSASSRTRYVLDGGGELLAIRVSPV
ncbi:HutD/Ves family protein [Xanthomonas hortorum]|uniref:HutD family protein n=1 Tax=Xanthomonas hortorum pv. pelargonii TaxID=453602 RepID=A0A6V7DXI6_9XANT|nr:HutD family protein [Xanthomonas hortorum]MCE4355051.1 HutD family protein [Xanthomonas hortorum pv. pelargonii]MCM5526573.1 HutD family protein [Xanthomonas hortorum pv. pelargonii]MCM5535416.1 HutD family protein [Xanthomonas hortorum pv. pelargonii]MCM5539421.1 HutD family protein [Xanthomonas hortorum pv. pelargonii]MCM5546909.1 HutD family protein [Xanthomonas hortorum pv. pelargonii]